MSVVPRPDCGKLIAIIILFIILVILVFLIVYF